LDLGLGQRVAIVTGAGTGIGAGIAHALVDEGARVVVVDRDRQRARRVAEGLGDRAIPVEADVTRRQAVDAMVAETMGAFGRVDILVNNVGLTLADWIEDIGDGDVERTFAVNMRAHLVCTQAVVGPMKAARWGRLIYLSSGSGMKPSAGLALYSASKFFIRGLGAAVGLELGRYNITANVVCPSDVYPEGDEPAETWGDPKLQAVSMAKAGVESFQALRAKRIEANPMRRSCAAQDVADVVCFLASERAGFINAQTLGVNGGAIPT